MYVDWVFLSISVGQFFRFSLHVCVVEFTAFFDSFVFFFFSMASSPPTVLILDHWFVRRLSSDLRSNFDARAAEHFNLLGDAVIHLHGVGGRTVKKLRLYDTTSVLFLP